jgi:hypothetical protein
MIGSGYKENIVQPGGGIALSSAQSVEDFRLFAEKHVEALIEWYKPKNKRKKHYSMFYRGATIVLSTLGLLIPVVAPLISEEWRTNAYHWGYVFALLAVFFIAVDRQFNFTSTWVRTLRAERQLETVLAEFRANWVKLAVTKPPPSEETFVQCGKDFVLKAQGVVGQETDTWAAETLASFSQLEKAVTTGAEEARKRYEAAVESMRAGALEITLTNPPQGGWWCSISLNGQIRKQNWRAPVCGIVDVPSGNVEVLVEAETMSGEKFIGSKAVAVASGPPSAVAMELQPIP